MKVSLLLIALFTIALAGCEKDQNQKLLGPYFKCSINGVASTFEPADLLNNNHFDCETKGDTVLNIGVTKLYEGMGFTVKSKSVADTVYTTYVLDGKNRAYYTNPKDLKRYVTDSNHKGVLTIKRNTFQAKTLLNTLQGQFSFEGIDTATNKTFKITSGEFLMELKRD